MIDAEDDCLVNADRYARDAERQGYRSISRQGQAKYRADGKRSNKYQAFRRAGLGKNLRKIIDGTVMERLRIILIYAIPLMFGLIGIWAFFYVLSMNYTRAISFIDWILSGPDNIISTLKDVDTVMSKIHRIILTRMFWIIWFTGFSISVFVLGKYIHNKKEDHSYYATIKRKEACNAIKNIIKVHSVLLSKNTDLEKKIKLLAERMGCESDFGYGDISVIECENEIKEKIDNLNKILRKTKSNVVDNQGDVIQAESILDEISIILDHRAELKKRQ